MKLLILSRSLNLGGAERQIVTLARALHARGHDVQVCTFYANGALEPELRAAGVPVHALEKRGRWDLLGFARSLVALVRRLEPDVLHSYLGTPNLFALLLRPLFPRLRLVWGVRASFMDLGQFGWASRMVYAAEARLARFVDLTIANSEAGKAYAVSRGFPADRTIVVPNGIDTVRFAPDSEARTRVRAEWGVPEDAPLVGMVARLDPMKGHPTFLRAAAVLSALRPEVRYVLVGGGPEAVRNALETLAGELGLGDRVVFAGARQDVAAVYSALDVATSASLGEGFPNVIGEAMACGVPCVVTDVGDSARIVDTLGVAVPPGQPEALAAGWERCFGEERTAIAHRVRARIVECYSVDRLAERTLEALSALLGAKEAA